MISKKNNAAQSPLNVPVYQNHYQDDEIDLRELMKVIWDYKWLTVLMCTIAFISAVFYALTAQERWIAHSKVVAPQLSDVAALYTRTENVKTVLMTGKIKVPSALNELFLLETLFNDFIDAFNSNNNKQQFLESNDLFLHLLKMQGIDFPIDIDDEEYYVKQRAFRSMLNDWMKEVTANVDKVSGEGTLSFQAYERLDAAEMLSLYINFTSRQVKKNKLMAFSIILQSVQHELMLSIPMLEAAAAKELEVLWQKTQYAHQVAEKAGIENYNAHFSGENDLFQINLGTKALSAQIGVLKSIDDLSFLDPKIARLKITSDALNRIETVDERSFEPFRFLENVQPPLNRAAPKRALIVILAVLLAGMLSIFIALMHYFLIKRESE